jgi:hypothetical protein
MTRLNEVERHGAAHVPKSDKSNTHVSSPSARTIAPASSEFRGVANVRRAGGPDSLKHQRGVGGKEKRLASSGFAGRTLTGRRSTPFLAGFAEFMQNVLTRVRFLAP